MSPVKRITCKECGKRRVKATIVNPETGKERKTPAKICQECHSKVIDYRFFSSSFGQWLRRAFHRQCTESIPKDTDELGGLIMLWLEFRVASGLCCDGESFSKKYDYQLCHIDPVKGAGGSVGALKPSNLIIAPAELNRRLSNLPYPATSGLSVQRGDPIDDNNFKEVCRQRYDLRRLQRDFDLDVRDKKKDLPVFENNGVYPSLVLLKELNRHGFRTDRLIDEDENPELVDSVYETFLKVGGALAKAELEGYQESTRKAMEWEYIYETLTPYKKKQPKDKRKNSAELDEF
ncbi:hypothetical protein [Pseudoalteromonas sp. T1lg10]|uniref:hypothetical protein n=1 Tax=Pseudoalteromonas sp. T1lg10 TaxID=2077093 RepID=UPI000CF710D6|nr:hypothetical protein [Pseudoalteromonas sp. T1lg10]